MKNSIILKQTKMLEKMFDLYNEKYFNGELNDVALTIQSQGRRKLTLGWCSVKEAWEKRKKGHETKDKEVYREINIVAEYLNEGIYRVSETLLHEMVHALNLQRGVKDCNPKTQNHNKKFKELAEQIGLIVEKVEKRGWANTSLSPLMCKAIEDLVKSGELEDVFDTARFTYEEKKPAERKPRKKYSCACGIKFSSTKDIDATCNVCGERFECEEE